jgi:hypothetical protein
VQQIRDFLDFNGRLIATSCRPSPRDCRRDELKPQANRLLSQGPFPALKIDLASWQVRLERLQSEPLAPVEGEEAHLRYLNLMYGGRLRARTPVPVIGNAGSSPARRTNRNGQDRAVVLQFE